MPKKRQVIWQYYIHCETEDVKDEAPEGGRV